jgi:hypothetical protein
VQQRRVVAHRLVHVDDMGQHLVIHFDQAERLAGDGVGGGGDGGDRMAVVQHLVARQQVLGEVLGVDRRFARLGDAGRRQRHTVTDDHRLDARQRPRLVGVDRADARVGVRAAQHAAPQHPRQREVCAVIGAAGHLVGAVVADGPGTDDLQVLWFVGHACCPFMAAAACWTARTILS